LRTAPTPPADAVTELRRAAEVVARFAPPGFQRDVVDIGRRIGLMITAFEHDGETTCRRCGERFTFNAEKFARLRFEPPRHCYPCRQQRRRERTSAGLPRGMLYHD
jgi:hypothetical protein